MAVLTEEYIAQVARVPNFAVTLQSSLLKQISSFRTKEELLDFVAAYHFALDLINLVTCLYRLAKMSFNQRSRSTYLAELQQQGPFQLLLREWGGRAGQGWGQHPVAADGQVVWQ